MSKRMLHKKLTWRIAISIAFVWAMSGCSQHIASFSRLSAHDLEFDDSKYEIDKSCRVKGKDTAFVFAIIPFGLPDATTAVKDAMRKNAACVGLANVSVRRNWFWLGLGYEQVETVGYPIRKKGGKQ